MSKLWRIAVVAAVCLVLRSTVNAQSITTIAGGADLDGRPATISRLDGLSGIAVAPDGSLTLSESGRVRRVVASGLLVTIAGNGAAASSGDGGPATQASLSPKQLDYDTAGNLYVVDAARSPGHVLRRIDAFSGTITRVAGGGNGSADGTPATAFDFGFIEDVDVDSRGNFYVTDARGVVRVDAVTQKTLRVAGDGTARPGDGGPATAAALSLPKGLILDEQRNLLYVADPFGRSVRRIDLTSGIITTVAGGGTSFGDGIPATSASISTPDDMAVDAAGNVYLGYLSRVFKIEMSSGLLRAIAGKTQTGFGGDGGPATAAVFSAPRFLAFSADGALHVGDPAGGRVRRIGPDTIVTTVAGVGTGTEIPVGDGGPATAASLRLSVGLSAMTGVAIDGGGNLYIADRGNFRIRRVDATGRIATIAGTGSVGPPTLGVSPVGKPLLAVTAIAVDPSGNVFFADTQSILRIDAASGILTRTAGGGQESRDGVPATSALLINPAGIAVDRSGNVFISVANKVHRVDAATNLIATFAGTGQSAAGPTGDGGPATLATLANPRGLAFDAMGDLHIADSANHVIRKVTISTGIITTVAGNGLPFFGGDGGPATAAGIDTPSGIAFDANGNLFIASRGGNRIRRVAAGSRMISTIAGVDTTFNFFPTYGGDDGPATRANLAFPEGLAVDRSGNIIFADTNANRVRIVYACIAVAAPGLSTPSNGSSGVSISPRLSWSPVREAFRYQVLVDTVNPPRRVAADVTSTSISSSNLQPSTTYYWQVIAKGDPYCAVPSSASSEVRSFTTVASCRESRVE